MTDKHNVVTLMTEERRREEALREAISSAIKTYLDGGGEMKIARKIAREATSYSTMIPRIK
jgi:hypothetical protein